MKKWGLWSGLTVFAVLLCFIQWHYPLPTGAVTVQIAGIIVIIIALGINLLQSYATLVVVTLTMLLMNINNWAMVVPILLSLLVVSMILHWQTPLTVHMSHTEAINFGLIAGLCQFVGMLAVVFVQALLITNKWDDFTMILGMGLPAALLNGLLDCLLIPPLTLWLRHYTEIVKKNRGWE